MKITISPQAEKRLRKIPKIDQIAIAQKIRSLTNPQSPTKAEKLHGYKDIFRIRIGDYRIVYRKLPNLLIHIILIAHRKDVYSLLEHWLS